ncbi:MAG: acyltransferase, partial [Fimbriimonadaceae bacterium]
MQRRIDELESLRGLMALWVVVGHAVHLLPMSNIDNPIIKLLKMNGLAVEVFVILSGFVIFNLLDGARERFWPFIVRRFLRLYPCYIVSLALSILMTPGNQEILSKLPWTTDRLVSVAHIEANALTFYWPNVAAHILMLQGAVPPNLIPDGEYAFLGQAWSISLEWQFYLVAPTIFMLCEKRARWPIFSLLVGICAAYYATGFRFGDGWLFRQSTYFFVGIVSFYVWRADYKLSQTWRRLLLPITVAAAYLLIPSWISLGIWAAVITSLLVVRQQGTERIENTICDVLRSKPLRWLGRISYSVYLTHMIVIYGLMRVLESFTSKPSEYSVLLIGLSVVGTLVLSDVFYR